MWPARWPPPPPSLPPPPPSPPPPPPHAPPRVLTADSDELAHTDISDHALQALRASRVQEVVIAARRGPAHSAFTLPELIGLTTKADVVLDAADHELVRRDLDTESDAVTRQKLEILRKLGDGSGP